MNTWRIVLSGCLVQLAAVAWADDDHSVVQTSATQPAPSAASSSGEAEWIWFPAAQGTQMPPGICFFRKTFDVNGPESALVQITCDDRYELYINGRRVGAGSQWQVMQAYNVLPYLRQGRNVVAVRAQNNDAGSAGLVARVTVKNRGGTEVSHSTNASWRASNRELPGWDRPMFNDSSWPRAHTFGELGATAPWGDRVMTADGSPVRRFHHSSEFRVERVVAPRHTGSLVAMTFNEWGDIIAAREGGPIIAAADTNRDGIPDRVRVACDKVTSCHGLLALNGDLYVVGNGPDGAGFYRLGDSDHDGVYETVAQLIQFERGMGEHGPHAPVLGPDGAIYLVVGNHTAPKKIADDGHPYHSTYEGDLVQPRYEDANSAEGFEAPGGMILRYELDTETVRVYAGGLRNSFDITFDRNGELFTHDSDMEWDEALPWFRPTRLLHIVPGAEFGWRSGWAKWPDYYLDSLPAVVDTGRGSPTGIAAYDHYMYPPRYHNALFSCDWSQGRILALHLKPTGGSYEAEAEVFLQGRPLNATDVAVGPDGWLYFCTGGRNTEGGIYRVVYTGRAPQPPKLTGIAQAVRQPQLDSAWSRQQLAMVQQQLGDDWDRQIVSVVNNRANRAEDRTRALDLMQLLGPFPDEALLLKLSTDDEPLVRKKAAWLMGIHSTATTGKRLVDMLADRDAAVRRQACQALVRARLFPPVEAILPLLADSDRFVAWAARLALENVPAEQWRDTVLTTDNQRVYLMGSVALVHGHCDKETALAIVERGRQIMAGYMTDDDFVDLLRVFQLALIEGEIEPAEAPSLARQLADEYPANEWRMNRELVRLLAYLQEASVLDRMLAELRGVTEEAEKLHVAFHLRFMPTGWTTESKFEVLQYLERARGLAGGNSLPTYVEAVARDFFGNFTVDEQQLILAHGARWPSAALSVLATLPEQPAETLIDQLIDLDQQIRQVADNEAVGNLRTGIVAVLGASGDDRGLAYLRILYDREPERRAELAMGLSQSPAGENWPLLVRSLPVVEGVMAQEVLTQLTGVDLRPSEPEPLRQAILCGLRLGAEGGQQAVALLQHWTGQQVSEPKASWDVALAAWQDWFHQHHPDSPPATLPTEEEGSRYTFQELLDFLAGDGGAQGDPHRGAAVFEKAQCAKCHRFGGRGEGVGPDLSSVGLRFQQREILESILFPSHVISDQYASKTILTTDGRTLSGIVGAAGDDKVVVLSSTGEKTLLAKDRIDEIVPNSKSTMPEGLLNTLTLEDIADLFAYLNQGAGQR